MTAPALDAGRGESGADLAHPFRLLKLQLLRSPLHAWVRPLADRLLPVLYKAKYLAWFHENQVERKLAPGGHGFGYEERYALYGSLSDQFGLDREEIHYLEFGVASGDSLRWWVGHNVNPGSRFVGFDSFHGLPEAWAGLPQGAFTTRGVPPDIDDPRCGFECGLFQETLPSFLRIFPFSGARSVLHLDADLYGSTLFVLVMLAPWLKRGDLLIFDEFTDVMNEFRALIDFQKVFPMTLRLVQAVNWGGRVALTVESRG